MQVVSFREIINLVILTLVVGYILSAYIHKPRRAYGGYDLYEKKPLFNWEDVKFAMIVAAPAVVIHELGHKFVAIAFGLPAFFEVWWTGIIIAVGLKVMGSPFLILAPGYVLIPQANDIQNLLISAAGPFMNLLLWGISSLVIKYRRRMSREEAIGFYLSKKINILLLVFNMLPIPPLDGFHVIKSLFGVFLGPF